MHSSVIFCFVLIDILHGIDTLLDTLWGLGLPPGPTPLPLIGNLHQLKSNDLGDVYREFGKKYGGLFTVWLSPKEPTVVITDPEILKEAFVTQGDAFNGRPATAAFHTLFDSGPPPAPMKQTYNWGVVFSYGDIWREHRRFIMHTLRNFGVSRYEFDDVELVQLLQLVKGNIEMLDLKMVILQEVAASVPFLKKIPLFGNWGSDQLQEGGRQLCVTFQKILDKQDVKFKDNPDMEPDCYATAYKQHRQMLIDTGKTDLAEMYSDYQLLWTSLDLWLAGEDTTTTTLSFGIGHMCAQPEIQHRVQQEIDNVLGATARVTMADKLKLPYTMACITEVQRISNLTPVNLQHATSEDVKFRGYLLKKGTTVEGSIGSIMYDPDYFPDPLKFNPDRFYNTDPATNNIDKVTPFSVGKRACAGESLARMELFLIFVTLMQHFRFAFASEKDKQSFVKTEVTFSRKPGHYKVNIVPRH